jgi:hypothetical protein
MNSEQPYDKYPKQNTKLHSITGEEVRNLNCLNTKELKMPSTNPVSIEKKARDKKLFKILKGVEKPKELSGPAYSMTVLKRIMHTASLVMPSPNTRLNNLGCCSYLITAIAATTSVQQRSEHIKRISIIDSSNYS